MDFEPIVAELVAASSREPRLTQFLSPITAHQYVRLYRLVRQHVPEGGRVLDWGSASGHFSYFLLRSGYRADAYSFEVMPEICRPWLGREFAFARGDESNPVTLPYADATFDAVTSCGVLEHVREFDGDELASLREIRRVLRPGGVFLCFHFPNQYSWIDAAARAVGRWAHEYRYTASEIRALGAGADMEILDLRRYAVLPRNIWSWGIPHALGSTHAMAKFYDHADSLLSTVFSPICQNYVFVARRPL